MPLGLMYNVQYTNVFIVSLPGIKPAFDQASQITDFQSDMETKQWNRTLMHIYPL